jgi:hypothetical protein
VPEPVFEPAEDAEIHLLFDLCGEHASERAVHGGARSLYACEQERQIDDSQRRNARGEIAGGLIA